MAFILKLPPKSCVPPNVGTALHLIIIADTVVIELNAMLLHVVRLSKYNGDVIFASVRHCVDAVVIF